jgi:NitT/TauT family transport system substrate-binding protein
MKKLLILLFSVYLLVFSGCSLFGSSQKTVQPQAEEMKNDEPVVISYTAWPPDSIAYLAEQKGFFEKHGVKVKLVKGEGFEDVNARIESGELDIWETPFFDLVLQSAEGKNWQAILVEDFSYGADGIVVSSASNITKIADLEGKKVAVEKQTVGDFFLQILLKREGISSSDLTLIDLSAEESVDALMKNEVDAAVTYEPYLTSSQVSGAKLLVDSKKEKGLIVDLLVARTEDIEKNKEKYSKVVNAWLDAVDFLKNNPEESAEILKDVVELSKEETVNILKSFNIPNLRDNETAFSRASGSESLYILGDLSKQYLLDQDMIKDDFDVEGLLNGTIIKNLKSQ